MGSRPCRPNRLDASQRRADERAVGEFIAAQSAALDLPGPHLNLAVLYENQGRHALAEEHYRPPFGSTRTSPRRG